MVIYIGADLGGSLSKLSVSSGGDPIKLGRRQRSNWRRLTGEGGQGILLGAVPTSKGNIDGIVSTIERLARGRKVKVVVTGGGIHKHDDVLSRLSKMANIELCTKNDEFRTLAMGLTFLQQRFHSRAQFYTLTDFLFHGDVGPDRAHISIKPTKLSPRTPMLVCNIGTGTSFVDIKSTKQYERLGGSSLGGGTFLGLCKGLIGEEVCPSFEAALALAAKGDSRRVDMMVGDIYGDGSDGLIPTGLRKSTLASSFAKLCTSNSDAAPEDKALSTLIMITMVLATISDLYARISGRRYVLFTGSFLHNNPLALRTLAYSIDFRSRGHRSALFIQHASHLASLGALSTALPPMAKL